MRHEGRVLALVLAGAALCLQGCGWQPPWEECIAPDYDDIPDRTPNMTTFLPHKLDCGGNCTLAIWCSNNHQDSNGNPVVCEDWTSPNSSEGCICFKTLTCDRVED